MIAVLKLWVSQDKFYKINKNITSAVFGHSHPECAFNDSLIENFKNFGEGGEFYLYTYQKIKKISQSNPQVKTVYVEFTNNQIDKSIENWINYDAFTEHWLPKYWHLMNLPDFRLLFNHNPKAVLRSVNGAIIEDFSFLTNNDRTFLRGKNWGGYLYLEKFKIDSLLKALNHKTTFDKRAENIISVANLSYLQKIVSLCSQKNIKLYLVRSPLHNLYNLNSNENEFQNLLNTKFTGVTFLDFKEFPLQNDDYADFEHLNYKGARKFSVFFNNIIRSKVFLKDKDPSQLVRDSIYSALHKEASFHE